MSDNNDLTHELRRLVTARKSALHADSNWADYSDTETNEAFARLEALQASLLATDFSRADHRLIALDLLLEGEDHPNFCDDFKNSLFGLLQALTGGAEQRGA